MASTLFIFFEDYEKGETDMKNNRGLLLDIFCGLVSFVWFLFCLMIIMVTFQFFFG